MAGGGVVVACAGDEPADRSEASEEPAEWLRLGRDLANTRAALDETRGGRHRRGRRDGLWRLGWWLASPPDDADGGLLAFRLGGDGDGDGDGPDPSGASDPADGPADEAGRGKDVYQQSWASCHGASGEGSSGPSLVGVDERLTREEHVEVVRQGRGSMAGWADALTAEEIEAVVDYERTVLAGGDV